jgi:hypothetical protein
MYNKTILRILEQIYINGSMHKRGLSKKLGLGMPSIDYALKKIDNILTKIKAGNQIKYSLNYSKKEIIPFLYIIEYSRIGLLPSKIRLSIFEFLKVLEQKPIIASIFGSYARGDYNKDSDIDIILVYQKVQPKHIENASKITNMKTNTHINPIYMNYDDFKKSFHDQTKRFFKNIRNEKITLIGIEWWRLLLDEEA